MSNVSSSSAAMAVVDRTAGVAAVSDVFSVASIVSVVLKTDVPFFLTSNAGAPDELAVVRLPLILVSVIALGARIVTFAVPVVRAVVSSPSATIQS